MFKDDVCDLVQIDLARVRKLRSELVATGATTAGSYAGFAARPSEMSRTPVAVTG